MKTLLALLLLIPSLSWGGNHSTWKKSSMTLTQVLQIQEAEIVHIEKVVEDKIYDKYLYHIRDINQFYICALETYIDKPELSYCWYEDW